jgi:spore coat polysaccharide biosynthesis predicted glycosyltransferase SpsG
VAARRLTVLFRVAAGPRLGFGHLVRAQRLAAALDADVWLSVRGMRDIPRRAPRMRLARQSVRSLEIVRPDLLVLDTPIVADGRRWVAAARRLSITVASVHDCGFAAVASDLAVDGSLAARRAIAGARRTLSGVQFIVIDPRASRRTVPIRNCGRHVLIALGGGARSGVATRLARAINLRQPEARIEIAGGFVSQMRLVGSNVRWLGPQPSLVPALSRADVAVVAGGLTLYESAALGVPTVPMAVVPAQRPTIAAFAKRGAVADPKVTLGAGRRLDADAINRVASAVANLLSDPARGRMLSTTARRLVDSRGAVRVARALEQLVAVNHRGQALAIRRGQSPAIRRGQSPAIRTGDSPRYRYRSAA